MKYRVVVLSLIGIVVLGASTLSAAPASARSSAVQRLCVEAFSAARETTVGPTTIYNRPASVQAVGCEGFGFDTGFHLDGGVVCSLLSASLGQYYDRLPLYIDGGCSGASLAANHDVGTESAAACGMLSDLLGAAPWAKEYALGAGVACAFGGPVGSWIEARSEQAAAEGVIESGLCLRFTERSFPRTDRWSAVACPDTVPESTVSIHSDPKGTLKFIPRRATAYAGKVTITLVNSSALAFDIAVEDSRGRKLGETSELVSEGSVSLTLRLRPGIYKYFCTVPGTREAGMEGTLLVL